MGLPVAEWRSLSGVGEVACDAAGGELRPEGEAAERAEAGCGGQPDEVEAGDGGFEVGGEDWGVFDLFHLVTEVGIDEVEALEPDFVAGSGDDVVDLEVFRGAVALAQVELESFVWDVCQDFDLLSVRAEVDGGAADDLVLCPPAGSRSVDAVKGQEAEFGRECVKE